MDKLKNQLGSIVTLIGLIGAIGAGFVKYGEVTERLNSMSAPDLSSINKEIKNNSTVIANQNTKIAVLEKTIKVLELEIQEFKVKNSNPLIKMFVLAVIVRIISMKYHLQIVDCFFNIFSFVFLRMSTNVFNCIAFSK